MNDSFAHLKQRVRDSFAGDLVARTRRALGGLHRNESGATLTEFVIVLPIFILIFNGVMILGQFTRKGQEQPIAAYKQTFEQVLPFQTDQWKPTHMQTGLASIKAIGHLGGPAKVHNESGATVLAANTTETTAYGGLGLRGHMGESYARTNALTAPPGTRLSGCDDVDAAWTDDCTELNDSSGAGALSTSNGRLTSDLTDLTGDSAYAYELFNDGTDAQKLSTSGTGLLKAINSIISTMGIRPVLGAGVRYGTVYGKSEESYTFAGRTMEMEAHFSTLVPPTPKGPGVVGDAAFATAVTRTTMVSHDHYENMLGIAKKQPLASESISVPSYP